VNNKLKVAVIIGSVRDTRFAEHAGTWIAGIANAHHDLDVEVLDLVNYPLPTLHDAVTPSWAHGAYSDPAVQAWSEKIKEFDAYIVTVAEYNHGYTGVLKNALDLIFGEWTNKPIAFVGYGSVGGARAVEQLRQVAIELQMAPIRNAVHIVAPWTLRDERGVLKEGALGGYMESAENMLTQLTWWASTLKAGRTGQIESVT
jgi:NAD(P)H-dependent FMN reductase